MESTLYTEFCVLSICGHFPRVCGYGQIIKVFFFEPQTVKNQCLVKEGKVWDPLTETHSYLCLGHGNLFQYSGLEKPMD